MYKYALNCFSLIPLSLDVKPYLGLILSVFLYLISFSGESLVVDETVVVPANGYTDWSIQMYPGQRLFVRTSAYADDHLEIIRGVLELWVMDEENFAYYESGDYSKAKERDQEWIDTNAYTHYDVNIKRFGRVHVVLNNRIRVLDPDSAKEADIIIKVLRPYGYIAFPSVILMGISLYKSYKQYKRARETSITLPE